MSALTHTQLVDKSTTTLGAVSTTVLAANTTRNFLLIENTHATNDVWLNLTGGTAAANGTGCIFLVHAGGATARVMLDTAVPMNAITALSTGANTTLTVLEA